MGDLNPREVALKILYRADEDKVYLNVVIDNTLKTIDMKQVNRALVVESVYGVTRWKLLLDYVIEQFSKIRIKKISPWIMNILRLGIYQIMFMDKIPVSAACDESVKLAQKYGHKASAGYVNGVLRNIARNLGNIRYPDKSKDSIKHLSVKYSFPEWMVSRWMQRYGEDFTVEFMKSSNEIPPITIRTNNLKISGEALKTELCKSGLKCQDGNYVSSAINLKHSGAIAEIPAFEKGYFQIQDESSMLAAQILNPKENEFVIDACAAPGGKATHIAELMKNKGTVIARDVHDHKIRFIEQSAKRLGIDIIKAEVHDALVFDNTLLGKADKVIVDAPCTGFGIIRRKPDIKWLRTEKQADEIVELQSKMLDVCSMYVKPGGIVVYSTCTIEPSENIDVFENFLRDHSEFCSMDFSDLLPVNLKKQTASKGYIQLYPNVDATDGFFIAKARRVR